MTDTTALLAVGLLFSPSLGLAQTGGPGTLEFSFSNPGARSLALAGAFAALADDATAVFANPAGLTQLTRPEISIEGRRWAYSTPFNRGGRVAGAATDAGLDSLGIREGISSATLYDASFASFVYPAQRWSFAFHRHTLANFESVAETQGVFLSTAEVPPFTVGATSDGVFRAADIRNVVRLDLVSYGVSVAYRLRDGLGVGAVVNVFDGDVGTTSEFFQPIPATLPEGFFGPTEYTPDARVIRSEVSTHDVDWGLSGGVLWSMTPQWRVGAFYRQAPTFDLQGEAHFDTDLFPFPGGPIAGATGSVSFPDVFGAGVAYRSPGGTLTLGGEWCRVQYSTILEELDLVPILDPSLITVLPAGGICGPAWPVMASSLGPHTWHGVSGGTSGSRVAERVTWSGRYIALDVPRRVGP